jgi:hypothetical protein
MSFKVTCRNIKNTNRRNKVKAVEGRQNGRRGMGEGEGGSHDEMDCALRVDSVGSLITH